MGKILIVNGSPRAPRSNSKRYAELLSRYCSVAPEYCEVKKSNHAVLCQTVGQYADVVLVFPLYADSIPVTLLNFMKTLEEHASDPKPTISVVVNCGFIEPYQNDIAVRMLRLFCAKNGFAFGSVLKIGSGEAILATPFRIFVQTKLKQFAASIETRRYKSFAVTMPLSKKMFIKASTTYWKKYGEKNGISPEQMATMRIEESSALPNTL